MIPLRLVLGIFEAGFFPGCAYLLSCWYPRYELQKRNAVFYLIGSMASAFAGILAYGLLQMHGLGGGHTYLGQRYGPTKQHPTAPKGQEGGIAGWRWIL
jgi:MFS family permease